MNLEYDIKKNTFITTYDTDGINKLDIRFITNGDNNLSKIIVYKKKLLFVSEYISLDNFTKPNNDTYRTYNITSIDKEKYINIIIFNNNLYIKSISNIIVHTNKCKSSFSSIVQLYTKNTITININNTIQICSHSNMSITHDRTIAQFTYVSQPSLNIYNHYGAIINSNVNVTIYSYNGLIIYINESLINIRSNGMYMYIYTDDGRKVYINDHSGIYLISNYVTIITKNNISVTSRGMDISTKDDIVIPKVVDKQNPEHHIQKTIPWD